MFNSLTGILTGKYPQKVYIDTHGIEWELTVPATAQDVLPAVGMTARIFTWMQHTDAIMTLYGFASEDDRSLFLDLLKVDGIGPKAAIKIMSNIDTPRLASVLDSGDVGVLEKVPGVGKKTAAKMLLALKGKLSLTANDSSRSSQRGKDAPYAAVIAALVDMGYEKNRAQQAVEDISAAMGGDESFAAKSVSEREDAVFRRAIVELAG